MTGPQIAWLPDGRRLHLHHGPIDLIVGAEGPDRMAAFDRAVARFATILDDLVAELPALRRAVAPGTCVEGAVARRMVAATRAHLPVFVTPMAAVAGAVADTVLAAMCDGSSLTRAYVNNGGDIAFHLAPGETFKALGPAGEIRLAAEEAARGLATSGWRGRSQSLGIADAVTVAARTAAEADAAATLVANAVDLPDHPAVARMPASALKPDSDLGTRPVTTGVGPLSATEIATALDRGAACARAMLARGLIAGAQLSLREVVRTVAPLPQLEEVS